MFGCPHCKEFENTMVGAGDYEQTFICGACGYQEDSYTGPFKIVTDPADPDEGIHYTLKPAEVKTLETLGHLVDVEERT